MPIYLNNKAFFSFESLKKNLLLQKGNGLFEVRFFPRGAHSGFFTADEEGIRMLIKELKRRGFLNKKITIYQSLHRIKRDVIPKEYINQLFKKGENGFHATCDNDVEAYNYIFIDVDPLHEANTQIPSSDLKYTEEAREKIISELKAFGFYNPMVVFSGNGQHIYLRIAEANTPEARMVIKQFLTVLSNKFSNDKLQIDTVVDNPSRITKLIGSYSTKGKDSPETPYRQCRLIEKGSEQVNDFQLVRDYISKNTAYLKSNESSKMTVKKSTPTQKANAKEQPKTSHQDFDENKKKYLPIYNVPEYLKKYNLEYSENEKNGYTLFQLSECPFNSEHNHGECALILVQGKGVCFHCFHNHCQDKTIFDFVSKYPCGTISPIDSDGKIEVVLNALVVNGKLLRSSKGSFFFHFRGNTYPLSSEELKGEIRKLSLNINKSVPEMNADTKIVKMLEAYSLDSSCYINAAIGQRIILHNDTIYYALSKNKFVIVNADGCEISSSIPNDIYFVHSKLEQQIMPDLNTAPEELPDLLLQVCNISGEQISLLVANLLSFFREDINSPVLVLKGSRGSCKSSCARIMKSIVHPEKVGLLSFPDREDSLVASLSNNALCVFDNVEKISEAMSSKLCLAVTNGYTTRRKLYSDNTEISICIRSNVILTCISDVVSQSDLAERSNVIHLERIDIYRTEAEVNRQVSSLMPKILGAIFNTLSAIFLTANDVIIDRPPRMADFAYFAMAAVKAVGLDENDFLDIYTKNVTEAVSVCAVDDPVIECVNKVLAEHNGSFETGSEQLLNEITRVASNMKISLHRYSSSSLSRALNSKSADLKSVGITFSREKRGSSRVIVLKRIEQPYADSIPVDEFEFELED